VKHQYVGGHQRLSQVCAAAGAVGGGANRIGVSGLALVFTTLLTLIASPGQRNDIAFAHDLIDGIEADASIAVAHRKPAIINDIPSVWL